MLSDIPSQATGTHFPHQGEDERLGWPLMTESENKFWQNGDLNSQSCGYETTIVPAVLVTSNHNKCSIAEPKEAIKVKPKTRPHEIDWEPVPDTEETPI